MLFLLHGAAGGWDELIIAVAAVGILWLAIKLSGRKKADDEQEEQAATDGVEEREEQPDPAAPRT